MATVLVLGSTGHVGNATVHALATKGIATRAGARDPASEKAAALAVLKGVEVVKADLGEPSTLAPAMTGVNTVYIVTPGAETRADLVAVGIDAAKTAGVAHIVIVSVPAVAAAGELMFKAQFSAIEAKAVASGLKYTFLRLPMFMDNQWASQGTIKTGKLYGPADGSKPVALVSVSDVGEAAAAVLAAPADHAFKKYTLAAEPITFNGIAAAFATATGQEVEYIQVPYAAALQSMVGLGFPEWMAKGVCELLQLVDSGDAAATPSSRELAALLGRAPTSFVAWVGPVAGAFKAE